MLLVLDIKDSDETKRSVYIQSSMLSLGSDDRQIHFRNYIPRTSGDLAQLGKKVLKPEMKSLGIICS